MSATFDQTSKTKRPDAVSFDYQTAFSLGPVAIGDQSEGAFSYVWRVRHDRAGLRLLICRESGAGWGAETVLFTYTGVTLDEIDLAFEQAGRPVICASRATGTLGASQVWLYWFNTISSAFEFSSFGSGRTPRVILDNPADLTRSDVQLFYLLDGTGLVHRQQRDRYATVLATAVTDTTDLYLDEVFFAVNWRIVVLLTTRHPVTGRYTVLRRETTLLPLYLPVLDATAASFSVQSGILVVVLIRHTLFDKEELDAPFTIRPSTLVDNIIHHTLHDADPLDAPFTIRPGGTLAGGLIQNTLFTKEQLDAPFTVRPGSTLAVVLIRQTLFDKEQLDAPFTVRPSTLA